MLKYPLLPENFDLYNSKIENVIRIVNTVSKGRESKQWRHYWDFQLSKVLENTWKEALLIGNKSRMNIEVVVNGHLVDFKPEIQEVKEIYYNELKAFVSWPMKVDGLGNHQLYRQIGERN